MLELVLLLLVGVTEGLGVPVEARPLLDDLDPELGVPDSADLRLHPEAVEELRAELPILGVPRADEDEARGLQLDAKLAGSGRRQVRAVARWGAAMGSGREEGLGFRWDSVVVVVCTNLKQWKLHSLRLFRKMDSNCATILYYSRNHSGPAIPELGLQTRLEGPRLEIESAGPFLLDVHVLASKFVNSLEEPFPFSATVERGEQGAESKSDVDFAGSLPPLAYPNVVEERTRRIDDRCSCIVRVLLVPRDIACG